MKLIEIKIDVSELDPAVAKKLFHALWLDSDFMEFDITKVPVIMRMASVDDKEDLICDESWVRGRGNWRVRMDERHS